MSKKHKEIKDYTKSENIHALAIDSHAHLDRDLDTERILAEMEKDGLKKIVLMAGDLKTALWASNLCKNHKNLYYMFGLHPYEIKYFNAEFVALIKQLKKEDKKLVGVGEIGLDYHEHDGMEPREKQLEIFLKQLELAHELKLPISIHIRDAHADAIQLLEANKHLLTNSGIIHCCSATKEEVKHYLDLGLYISFSGSITYGKKNQVYYLEETLKAVPNDKLLIETDCPFLCPSPYRGRVNEPKYVLVTAEKIAEILGIDINDLLDLTTKNAERLLRI